MTTFTKNTLRVASANKCHRKPVIDFPGTGRRAYFRKSRSFR